jgi:mono/diheme cytochrome c family protein
MNPMKKRQIQLPKIISLIRFLAAFFILMVGISCDRDKNHPGYDYFPDMAYSRTYETNSPNPNFANKSTEREPVSGSISREMMPFPYQKTEEDQKRAGRELHSPYKTLNDSILMAGENLFNTFCVVCHGNKGDGKGQLFTSGKYTYPPASLISDKVKTLPDGSIYHTITVGFGIMGAHGSQILPDDRWKIIYYIRNKLQKD